MLRYLWDEFYEQNLFFCQIKRNHFIGNEFLRMSPPSLVCSDLTVFKLFAKKWWSWEFHFSLYHFLSLSLSSSFSFSYLVLCVSLTVIFYGSNCLPFYSSPTSWYLSPMLYLLVLLEIFCKIYKVSSFFAGSIISCFLCFPTLIFLFLDNLFKTFLFFEF